MPTMTLDSPTLFLLASVIFGATAGFQLLVSNRVFGAALRIWAMSNLVFSAGYALFTTREFLSVPISITLANMLLSGGCGLTLAGISVFNGHPFRPFETFALMAYTVVTFWIAFSIDPDLGMRTLFISGSTAYFAARFTFLLSTIPKNCSPPIRYLCSTLVIAFAVYYAVRSFGYYFGVFGPASGTTGNSAAVMRMMTITLIVIWNFGLLFLVLDREASVDGLTGALNRRAMMDSGSALVKRTLAAGRPAAVLMMDLDHFKGINDRFGHAVGDQVLRDFGALLARTVRGEDLVGRLGGEEFCIVLPGCDGSQALRVAERLRATCAAQTGRDTAGMPITISIGVAAAASGGATFGGLLRLADTALYKAKADGRNRVRVIGEFEDTPEGVVSLLSAARRVAD